MTRLRWAVGVVCVFGADVSAGAQNAAVAGVASSLTPAPAFGALMVGQGPVNVGSSVVTVPMLARIDSFAMTVKGQPYSLVEKTTTVRTLADGTTMRTTHEERKIRDVEGRTRVEILHEFNGEMTVTVVTISDPVARTRTTLNVRQKMAHTFHVPEQKDPAPTPTPATERLAETRPGTPRSGPNFQVEKLDGKMVSGVFAEGTRTTRVIPVGMEGNDREIRVVTEQWVSPDLKIVVARLVDDPRSAQSSMEVSDLRRVDPDAAVFQVPAGYKMIAQPSMGATQ